MMASLRQNLMDRINNIDIDDLEYAERDLCFYELVSLGFLLYGREKTTSEYILQKLIVLQQNPPEGKGDATASSDILRKYATINTNTWRVNIVEALSIIRAKKVLRKLGLKWSELHDIYLPHIPELSVHIHPMLKALYKICERLTPSQAGRLVIKINEMHLSHESQNLRFYDYSNLEVFLLFWLTRGVIAIGDQNLQGVDMLNLISYFKLNDLDSMKAILVDTIDHNKCQVNLPRADVPVSSNNNQQRNSARQESDANKDSGAVMESLDMLLSAEQSQPNVNGVFAPDNEEFDGSERYIIRNQKAGYVLIINQSSFYADSNPEWKHLLPKIPFKKHRAGTDADRDNLKKLFSSFGYTPLVYDNVTHVEMLNIINQTVQKSLIRDSLIVCILTHGMEGVVYGCNSIPVSINSIKDIMADDSLKGKPKLLIVQACQKDTAPLNTSVSNGYKSFEPDVYADMLTAMSSIAGTEALRHTITGSWFIESLCKFIEKWSDRKHMVDILTIVTADVAKRRDKNDYMLPIMTSTLRKDFFLPPRIQ
ncbi:caspase-8-like [Haematobia irritans]|uniref:caspase-8-like n=1 Tax=Haematobia irritans TaxID=7368 RepID=UPI003F50B77C